MGLCRRSQVPPQQKPSVSSGLSRSLSAGISLRFRPKRRERHMPDAYEIYYRTSSSANEESGSLDAPQLPCRDWVTITGKYLDKWNTPMAGAEFRLWINGKLVLPKEFLKDYSHADLKPGETPEKNKQAE